MARELCTELSADGVEFLAEVDAEDRIARVLARARIGERERCAKVADLYADVNIEAAGDSILLDPCLNGAGFTPANLAVSERMIVEGCVRSSKFHAAQDIAANIRAMKDRP